MKYYNNKNIYITGGSSGIGLEMAKQLFGYGATITIIGRNEIKLRNAKKSIEKFRIKADQKLFELSLDVSNNENVEHKISEKIEINGTPDILINSAGIAFSGKFENTDFDTFKIILDTNVLGVRNISHTMIPYMKTNGGVIANLSSFAGIFGAYGYSAYSASKFAVLGMSSSMRMELAEYNIKVCAICPPEVDTPLVREESKTISQEAKALKKMLGFLSVEYAAKSILKELRKEKFLIIPGKKAKLTYHINRLFPSITMLISNLVLKINLKK